MLRRRSSTPGKQMSLKAIFTKFMDFLGSPMWTLSIATFIEQKSIVFDREQGNPDTYAEIHKEFSSFVDTLIECFCEDLKITPRSLVDSLKSNDDKKLTSKEKTLLEPVIAAQDFDVFLPMMMRKNVELQLQALHMIEVMCGLLPTVLTVEEDEETQRVLADADETERYILIQVLQQSRAEWEADQANRALLQKQFEDAIRESLLDRARLMAMKESEDKAMNDALQMNSVKSFGDLKIGAAEREKHKSDGGSQATSSQAAVNATDLMKSVEKFDPTESEKPREKDVEQAKEGTDKTVRGRTSKNKSRIDNPGTVSRDNSKSPNPKSDEKEITKKRPSTSKSRKALGEVKPPIAPSSHLEKEQEKQSKQGNFDYKSLLRDSGGGISEDAVRARALYLKEQRDKLLALKHQEREKQFQEQEAKSTMERPKTAKFARGALRGAAVAKPINEDVLEARKAVANKLKSELMNS